MGMGTLSEDALYYDGHEILTKEQTYDLIRKSQDGDMVARNKIIEHNMLFIYKKANYWCKWAKSLTRVDMVQEGVLGLMKAISRFDFDKDVTLLTYAEFWINEFMRAAIYTKDRIIRLPADVDKGYRATFLQPPKSGLSISSDKNPGVDQRGDFDHLDDWTMTWESVKGNAYFEDTWTNNNESDFVVDIEDEDYMRVVLDDLDIDAEDRSILDHYVEIEGRSFNRVAFQVNRSDMFVRRVLPRIKMEVMKSIQRHAA